MSLLDRFRSDPTADLLRDEPVLALPANLASARVAAYAREWAPGAVTTGTGVLKLDDTVELHGPVSYDETLWRRAKLPADCAVAYAARRRPADDSEYSDAYVDLIIGLCNRVGGRWREFVHAGWEDPDTGPPDPYVYTPRMLAPEEALRLLTPILPGLAFVGSGETGYALDADDVSIAVDTEYFTVYPLVSLQPWFASAPQVTEYGIVPYQDTPAARERTVMAATAIADVTAGLVLGEYGFPWRDR
jgi:hypothetical protein